MTPHVTPELFAEHCRRTVHHVAQRLKQRQVKRCHSSHRCQVKSMQSVTVAVPRSYM